MATSKEMTSGRPFPLIFNFALPLLLGNLLQQTYSLVDAAIVGQFLGINDLAAVGASTSVVFLILGFCNGCCGDSASRWHRSSVRGITARCGGWCRSVCN